MFFTYKAKGIACSIQWIGLALTTVLTFSAEAAQLNSRSDLNNLLGSNLVFENFETPSITSHTRYSGGSFSASTDFAGLGTHLIVDGVTFQRNTSVVGVGAPGYRGIDWNPSGYFGASSQRLSGAGGSGGTRALRKPSAPMS